MTAILRYKVLFYVTGTVTLNFHDEQSTFLGDNYHDVQSTFLGDNNHYVQSTFLGDSYHNVQSTFPDKS